MADAPLNPSLHHALERTYGEVEIVSEGIEINWRVVREDVINREGKSEQRIRRDILDSGEEYRVCCSICKDYRPRLYFNHRWGVWDPEARSNNLHLVNCFNEDCLHEFAQQRRLFERLYNTNFYLKNEVNRNRVPINPGEPNKNDGTVGEISPPGPMIRLDHLLKKNPEHHAIRYLEDRFFDCDKLGRLWAVSYCDSSRYSLAGNRIIIPIIQDHMMVGWQARHIGDDYQGTPFNKAGVPKYWTSPGFHRKLVSYNMDRATQHSTVVIVEGPMDVWRVGPQGIGLFGKTMSQFVRKQLFKRMKKHSEAAVVVMLDPNADKVASKRERYKHHIDKLVEQLREPFDRRVVPVWLPEDTDPGSTDRELLRDLIRKAAAKLKVKVDFARPK